MGISELLLWEIEKRLNITLYVLILGLCGKLPLIVKSNKILRSQI